MRSLQLKFTIALLTTSLTAVLLVGVVSRGLLLRKFNQAAMEQSFQAFQGDLQTYIKTYGSWEQGEAQLPFRQWTRQAHGPSSGTPGGQEAPSSGVVQPAVAPQPALGQPAPLGQQPAPGQQPQLGQRPPFGQQLQPGQPPQPQPGQALGFGQQPQPGQASGFGQQPSVGSNDGGFVPGNASAPPPPPQPEGNGPRGDESEGRQGPPNGGGEAPFRFIVLSPAGRVLMGPPNLRNQPAPDNLREQAQPVVVNGKVAVLVVPTAEPNLSPQDMANLAALKEALVRGIVVAMVLAVGMGLFLGHRLGSNLRELTGAIEAVGAGKLRQRVEVNSQDEVGVLADAFNRMSEELAQTHEKLQLSHAQVSEQAARLQELSVRDALTQLHNRRHFDTQVAQLYAQAQRYERPLTVMIGDIDHFKRINDSFSHAVGDDVLRHVGAILKKLTRQSDIVARYGGEEFVIAFPETPLPQAVALCERLRQQIEAYPWHKLQPTLRVTMSMGLNDDLSLKSSEKMVAAADELLYQAKEGGRNKVCAPVTSSDALKEGTLLQLGEGKPQLSVAGKEVG